VLESLGRLAEISKAVNPILHNTVTVTTDGNYKRFAHWGVWK